MASASVKICTVDKKDEMTLPLIEETFKKAGIEIEIRSHYDTAYDGLFVGQRGLASIYVLKEDEEQGRAILRDLLGAG
jgi:hypothetical protein